MTDPYSTAFASANRAPIWNVSGPGLATMSTPQKPRSSAAQRAWPIASLSSSADTNVANSGAEKLMAMAPASGIRLKAMSRNVCEQPCETERMRWCDKRRVRKTESPACGRMKMRQLISATTVRVNSTSPTG